MKKFMSRLFYYVTNFKTFATKISQRYNFLRHRWILSIKTALNRADSKDKIAVSILKFDALFVELSKKGKVCVAERK